LIITISHDQINEQLIKPLNNC